jgi:hypothetical protein
MAAKDSTSRSRRGNKKLGRIGRAEAASESVPSALHRTTEIPLALRHAIEAERARLMDAEAILHCVVLALDASDGSSEQHPYYQRVIDTARDKIVTAVEQLDLVSLRTVLHSVKQGDEISDGDSAFTKHSVREAVSAYLH